MVEIKITENEVRNEYLIEPYQAFLGARYDNLSDEIKVIFPQRELDNESTCTMIITNSDHEIDCVTIRHNEVFKLHSPMSHYKQVFIGFSFQKPDGYVKNTNIGVFLFRDAQNPDAVVPTTPIQREKINLLLANGITDVTVAEEDSSTMEFKNVDGEKIAEFTVPKGEDGEAILYCKQGGAWTVGEQYLIGLAYFDGMPRVGDLVVTANGYLGKVEDKLDEYCVYLRILLDLKGADYVLTAEDKTEIKNSVLADLPFYDGEITVIEDDTQ